MACAVQVTCETLGLPDGSSHSALGSVPATTWAQFIWSRGRHVGAPLALHMLQQMPLEQLAAQLPSELHLRRELLRNSSAQHVVVLQERNPILKLFLVVSCCSLLQSIVWLQS